MGIIRSYYYIDSEPTLNQWLNEEYTRTIQNGLELYLNSDIKIHSSNYTRAGGEFYISIPKSINNNLTYNDYITITIKGFTKYIKIPLSICKSIESIDKSENPQYIMSLWTYDFSSLSDLKSTIEGLAKHYYFHKCMLNIEKYEILVRRSYIQYYMENLIISKAVSLGHIKFINKNDQFTQYNETYYNHGYKYQCVFMNLQLLQYWTQNVRLFFWDTDEFINVSPLTVKELHRNIKTYSAVSFQRKSTICLNCNTSYPEYKFPFNSHKYGKSEEHISAKVAVNPNDVGLMLVHFAIINNGLKIRLDSRIAYIIHFENYYRTRFSASDINFKKLDVSNLYSCEKDYLNQNDVNVLKLVKEQNVLYHGNDIVSFYFQFERYLIAGIIISSLCIIFKFCYRKLK